jgi:ribosomal protein L37E
MPNLCKDMSGQTIANVRVVSRAGSTNKGAATWNVECTSCSTVFVMRGDNIRRNLGSSRPLMACPTCFPAFSRGVKIAAWSKHLLGSPERSSLEKICHRCGSQSWRVPRKIRSCPKCNLGFGPEKIAREEVRKSGPLASLIDGGY